MNRYLCLLLVMTACLAITLLLFTGSQTTLSHVQFRELLGTVITLFLLRGSQGTASHIYQVHDIRFDPIRGPMISSDSVARIGSSVDSFGEPAMLAIGKNENVDHMDFRMVSIGPGSPVFTRHGPITVLRSASSPESGLLIFNDIGARNFTSSCQHPETRLRIPLEYFREHDAYGISRVGYQLQLSPSDEPTTSPYTSTYYERVILLKNAPITDLPPQVLEYIIYEIYTRETLARPLSVRDRQSIIARLPRIIITFPSNTDRQLVLNPQDYEQFVIDEVIPSYRIPLGFNPLRIPNVNVHIAMDHIEICAVSREQ